MPIHELPGVFRLLAGSSRDLCQLPFFDTWKSHAAVYATFDFTDEVFR
jgi:hypothetical protein